MAPPDEPTRSRDPAGNRASRRAHRSRPRARFLGQGRRFAPIRRKLLGGQDCASRRGECARRHSRCRRRSAVRDHHDPGASGRASRATRASRARYCQSRSRSGWGPGSQSTGYPQSSWHLATRCRSPTERRWNRRCAEPTTLTSSRCSRAGAVIQTARQSVRFSGCSSM